MPLFYALTLFASAALLFLVQPMVGRMVLPLLGGTPAVWATCMLFFQFVLLLGYLYAHFVSKLKLDAQVRVHLAVLMLAALWMVGAAAFMPTHAAIPVLPGLSPQGTEYPYLPILALLGTAIGLPFFAVSTSAPLLQKWFSESGHPASKDPYFLYSASNVGSLLSLLAYPLLIESTLSVVYQTWLFALGFLVLLVLIYQCAQLMWAQIRATPPPAPTAVSAALTRVPDLTPAPTWGTRLRWIGLSFVPSSLMLAVTTYISTDIASLPLLWVIPLSIYLISFIIAFARLSSVVMIVMTLCAPVLVLLLVFMIASGTEPTNYGVKLGLHVLNFAVLAVVLHGDLARRRPATKYLTEFYLWMSVGGMFGGLFNGLLAPIIFDNTYEYALTLVVACLLLPKLDPATRDTLRAKALDWALPLVLLLLAWQLTLWGNPLYTKLDEIVPERFAPKTLAIVLIYGLPAMVAYFFVERPLRFGLSVAVLLALANSKEFATEDPSDDHVIGTVHRERSYFGVLKVERDNLNDRLVHGTTLHGTQNRYAIHFQVGSTLYPFGARDPFTLVACLSNGDSYWRSPLGRDPLTYYHRTGPVGSVFEAVEKVNPGGEVGMIGLGTGSLSSYLKPGQRGTIFEIDAQVRNLVENLPSPEKPFFTYLKRAREQGAVIDFQMGDARLKLVDVTDRKFAVLLVDAFSSDAIPVHLLTKEAVQLYFDRLEDDGLVCLHISNRHLNLEPVCEGIARALGKVSRVMHDSEEAASGKTASTWVVLANNDTAFGPIAGDSRWTALERSDSVPLWTDDFSSLMSVLNFKEVKAVRRLFGLEAAKPDAE